MTALGIPNAATHSTSRHENLRKDLVESPKSQGDEDHILDLAEIKDLRPQSILPIISYFIRVMKAVQTQSQCA